MRMQIGVSRGGPFVRRCLFAVLAVGCASPPSPPQDKDGSLSRSPQPPSARSPQGGWIGPDPGAGGAEKPVRTLEELKAAQKFFRKNQTSPLGVNLRPLERETPELPFLNLFRMAAPWISRSADHWNDGRPLSVDAHGGVTALLPGQMAATILPAGLGETLVLLWQGGGRFFVENAQRVHQLADQRFSFEPDPSVSPVLNLADVFRSEPAVQMAVVPRGFEHNYKKQVFHPLFLERLAPFSVVRFTGWSRVGTGTVAQWSDRTSPNQLFQSGPSGVAYELQLELVNRIGADIWISVPIRGDDNFVLKLAEMLKNKLSSQLRVYVEWGNRPWDPGSASGQYAEQQGLKAKHHPRGDQARDAYHLRRSAEVFQIFAKVFEETPAQLVRVLSAPVHEPKRLARWLRKKEIRKRVDAVAVEVYVGEELLEADNAGWLRDQTEKQVLAHLQNKSLPRALSRVRASARIAKRHRLDLIASSGGIPLVGPPQWAQDNNINRTFDALRKHPDLGPLVQRLLTEWKKSGGKTFLFSALAGPSTPQDRGAALTRIDQPVGQAPTYQALLQFTEESPRWWDRPNNLSQNH